MFSAINKKTNKLVSSLTVEEDPSYQFLKDEVWFADCNEIESCPDYVDITKIIVRFREGSSAISSKGKKYLISSHFFIPNKTKLGINTIPESKEHKLAKEWIYNKIKNKKLSLNYSHITKPYKYNNQINLFDLPIDFSKIGIEVTSSKVGNLNVRRADIICPFIVKHPLLGNGLIIEIQFSKQRIKTKISREYDWAIRGYSIAWLFIEDFEYITSNFIELKKDSINVSSFAALIKQNNKSFVKELKFQVQEECRKIDLKIQELKDVSLQAGIDLRNQINQAKIDKMNLDMDQLKIFVKSEFDKLKENVQPICPQCHIPMLLKSNRSGDSYFWACSNYPSCRCTSTYTK